MYKENKAPCKGRKVRGALFLFCFFVLVSIALASSVSTFVQFRKRCPSPSVQMTGSRVFFLFPQQLESKWCSIKTPRSCQHSASGVLGEGSLEREITRATREAHAGRVSSSNCRSRTRFDGPRRRRLRYMPLHT